MISFTIHSRTPAERAATGSKTPARSNALADTARRESANSLTRKQMMLASAEKEKGGSTSTRQRAQATGATTNRDGSSIGLTLAIKVLHRTWKISVIRVRSLRVQKVHQLTIFLKYDYATAALNNQLSEPLWVHQRDTRVWRREQ
jgi:hypothetical protein